MQDLFDTSQFREDFIEETVEILDSLDKELIKLENEPDNMELLNSIFRAVHTLKGSSAFLNFLTIKDLAHVVESVFDKLRNKKLTLTSNIMDVIFEAYDYFKLMVNKVIDEGTDKMDISSILNKLENIKEYGDSKEKTSKTKKQSNKKAEEEKVKFNTDTEKSVEQIIEKTDSNEIDIVNKENLLEKEDDVSDEIEEDIDYESETLSKESKIPNSASQQVKGLHSIRVDTRRVDVLMNLVSELVTGRNRLIQVGSQFKSEDLDDSLFFIEKVVTEVQSAVMKIRMVPLEKVFSRFPRIVRDLEKKLEKNIKFIIEGEETELDRVVSDEIYDPLLHMIRNAVDHGVEIPEVRKKNKKNEQGTIILKAKQEDNFVYIDITDDGKGIDYKVIREKAIKKGIITREQSDNMSEYDIINLIFAPGFSTTEEVTEVSGRGVGMDVVKSSIEKLGGIVDIITEYGKGSTFRIRLPLTLAIMQVLIIGVANKKYAIPLNSVLETIRIEKTEIKTISGEEVIFLREKTLPIVYLSSVFNIEEYEKMDKKLNIVVLGIGANRVGLVIDEMYGKQEIVIKPLGKYLGKVEGITGTTILGDGTIIMILDSGLIANEGKSFSKKKNFIKSEKTFHKKTINVLYVEDSTTMQKMAKRALELNGYRVDTVFNGIEGLEKIKEKKYDLIISDYNMPVMNGYEFFNEIRKNDAHKFIPTILLTSENIDIEDGEWGELNLSAYLKKPFNENKMMKTIENIFREG